MLQANEMSMLRHSPSPLLLFSLPPPYHSLLLLCIITSRRRYNTNEPPREAQKELQNISLDTNFNIPGDPGFPLNQMFEAPGSRQDAELLKQYLMQVRQELAARLLARIYSDGQGGSVDVPSKWWLSFTKRKFMGKSL